MWLLWEKIWLSWLTLREISRYSSKQRRKKEREFLMKKLWIEEKNIKKINEIFSNNDKEKK